MENNNQNNKKRYGKYLPIGTVVLMKNAKKRVMITGFCATSEKDGNAIKYDYCGVVYPEGVISLNKTCLFNHNQIAKIYHIGLIDKEERAFKEKLKDMINKDKQKQEK